MAVRRVQLRRGTTAENDAFTGAVGEITVDTQTNTVRVHNGATAGGQDLLRTDMANNENITSDLNVTGSITIGPALGANTITLGQAGSTIEIPGTLNVATQNTTNDLLIRDKVIVLADGSEGEPHADDSIGLIFTRPLTAGGAAQDPGLIYWDEVANRFVISTNAVDEIDAVWNAGGTPTAVLMGALDLNEGNITNVADIALDTISAYGDTIAVSLKQAGVGSAFSIADDGGVTHLTIDATNGSEKLIIDSPTFEVDTATDTSILGNVVINEGGVDKDFRVEGVGEANALFVQGSDGFVGINNGAPTAQLEVTGNSILDGAVSLNTSRADVDFNVATSNAGGLLNSLFVQGSDGYVGINNGVPAFNLDVVGTSAFSGTARFSGDVDLRTQVGPNNGITFNKGIANDTTDANLLRVDRSGSFSTLTWDATNSRFVWDTDLQISSGGLLMGGVNSSVSVPTNGAGAGFSLTLSSGVGSAGDGSNDGSLILRSGSTPVLTLDTAELATFAGNIAVPNAGIIGSNIVNAQSLQLGNDVGSTTYVRGILKVGADNIASSGGTQALALSGTNVETKGNLKVTGNTIQQNGALNATEAVMTFSGDANKTVTFAGGISSTTNISTEADLVVKGGDITLGKASGADTSISVPTNDQGGAGWAMTLSSGVGNAGDGSDDGDLILRTGTTPVLTLDTDEKATFTGDIDLTKASPTIGASVGNGETLTLGGAGTSVVVATSGDLRVNGNGIQDSAGTESIAFSGDSATTTLTATTTILSGDLRINGNDILSGDGTTTITMANDGSLVTIGADLKVAGNGIQDSAGAEVIAFSGDRASTTLTATTTILSGDLRIQGGDILSPDGLSTSITIDNNDNVAITGDLTVTGNDLSFGNGATLVNTDADTLTITEQDVVLSGDLTVGGNTIKSNGGTDAIELLNSAVSTKGVLNVEGTTVTLSTDAGGDATIKPFTRSTENGAGHDLILQGGASDGTGAGGSIVFKTQPTDAGGVGSQEANQAVALTIDGAKLATFEGAVIIGGNLTVNGTTTTIDTANLQVEDPVILLNRNATAGRDMGLFMERNADNAALFYWDEGDDKFIFSTTTAEATAIDFGGAISLQVARALGFEATTSGVKIDGGSLIIDTVNSDFVVNADGVLTSKNTASFTARSETALVVADTAGGNGNTLVIDTTNGFVETRGIMPLADSTHDLGTDALRFSTGYFNNFDVDIDLTLSGTGTFSGAVTYSNASPISITTAGTNGITFRSNADADVLGRADATLIRVAEGDATFSTLSWDESYDGFSFSSKTNSVGDFGVGAVGTETFYVTATSGDVKIEGDIATATDENKNIFAGVTTAGRVIAVGGGTQVVLSTGELRLTGNVIQNSQSEDTITLDVDQNVTIANNLKVGGGVIQDTNGNNTITLSNDDVTILGSLTVTGTGTDKISVGAGDANGSEFVVTPRTAGGAVDLAGGSLTIAGGGSVGTGAGGSILFKTSITGGVSNNVANSFQTIMTLNTAGEVVLGTDAGGQEIIKAADTAGGAGNDLVIASGLGNGAGANDGDLILRTGSTAVLTLDTDEKATFAGDIEIGGANITSDADEAKNIFTDVTNTITIGGNGLVAVGGDLKVTGNGIQDGAGTEVIAFTGDSASTTLTATTTILSNNLQINGTDITADVVGEARNIFATTTGTITLGGAGAVELGGTLKVAGQTISGRTDNDLIINSDTDMTFRVDADNDGDNSFFFKNGANGTVLTLDEAGDLTTTGDVSIATTKTLTLNSGAAGADSDIVINRNGADNAVLRWVEGNGRFEVDNASGGTFYKLLTENDTLFNIDVDGDANTIAISQDPTHTITLQGSSAVKNQGLNFTIAGDVITLGFENLVAMPSALNVDGNLSVGSQLYIDSNGGTVDIDVDAATTTFAQSLGANTMTIGGATSTIDIAGTLQVKQSAGVAKTSILLNSDNTDAPADIEDVSIAVERGTGTNAKITWDEGDDRWTLDQGTGTSSPIVTTTASEGARPSTTEPVFAGNATTLSAPTAVQNEHIYFLDNDGAAQGTVNLFTLTGSNVNGYKITFINIDASQNMVIEGSGAEQVGGANNQTVASGSTLTIVAYGNNWYIV